MKQLFYVALLLLLSLSVGLAQQVTNVRAQAEGDVVRIRYDLKDSTSEQVYNITVYSLINGQRKQLVHVAGDVGARISAGSDKVVIWSAKKELSYYSGSLAFEVEAKLALSPILIQSPGSQAVLKRGKAHTVVWTGGLANEKLKIELLNAGNLSIPVEELSNRGKYVWSIPANTKPGKGYQLKITSLNDPANTKLSEEFRIRRKIPLAAKLLPLGILAGVVFILTSDTSTSGGEAEDSILPAPPINP